MDGLLQAAEELLEVASQVDEDCETAIVIDRSGGVRILSGDGWALPALAAEAGAAAVFRLRRRVGVVRVEGWQGSKRCLLERTSPGVALSQNVLAHWMPAVPNRIH